MNRTHFHSSASRHLTASQGQGLVEYAILIAVVGLLAIIGLILFGGSVEGGFIKICAELGNDQCQVAQGETPIAGTPVIPTPTLPVSMTPSLVPTATPTLPEPDPTRQSDLPILTTVPEPTKELLTLRIKVILKGNGKKSPGGIQVVVYTTAGVYVAQGVTDSKGNISFSVQSGSYNVATFYNSVWQMDGPFAVSNSKEHVIRR